MLNIFISDLPSHVNLVSNSGTDYIQELKERHPALLLFCQYCRSLSECFYNLIALIEYWSVSLHLINLLTLFQFLKMHDR